MKKILFALALLIYTGAFSQNELKSIDESLKKLDTTVRELRDELIKKDPDPYTGQSMFEDRKGNSAIFLPSGGTFRLNTSDASLKLSFANRVSNKSLFYGFDVSGKTNDGILPLISKGNISPGAKANGYIGIQELFKKFDALDGWLVLKAGYEGAAFKLFTSDSAFSNQIDQEKHSIRLLLPLVLT